MSLYTSNRFAEPAHIQAYAKRRVSRPLVAAQEAVRSPLANRDTVTEACYADFFVSERGANAGRAQQAS